PLSADDYRALADAGLDPVEAARVLFAVLSAEEDVSADEGAAMLGADRAVAGGLADALVAQGLLIAVPRGYRPGPLDTAQTLDLNMWAIDMLPEEVLEKEGILPVPASMRASMARRP